MVQSTLTRYWLLSVLQGVRDDCLQWLDETFISGSSWFLLLFWAWNSMGKHAHCNLKSIVSRYTRMQAFHISEENKWQSLTALMFESSFCALWHSTAVNMHCTVSCSVFQVCRIFLHIICTSSVLIMSYCAWHCSLERRKSSLTRNMLFLLHWEVEVSMIRCFLLVDLKMFYCQNEPLVMYACTSFFQS